MTEKTKGLVLPIALSALTSMVITGLAAWFTVIRQFDAEVRERPTFVETRRIVATEAPYIQDRSLLVGLPDELGKLSDAITKLNTEVAELRGEIRATRPGGTP